MATSLAASHEVEQAQAPAARRCELVTEFARLEALGPHWQRLFDSVAPAGGMFQSWPWTRAFWSVHGHELRLCTPVVFEGDDLVGILPVAVRGRTARLLGDPYADYNGLLCAPGHAALVVPGVFKALLEAPVGWRQCIFEGVRAGSPLLGEAGMPSWLLERRQVTFGYSCSATVNDGAVLRKFARKHALVNKENRLKRLGQVSMRHLEDREEILSKHLERFFELQISRQALMGLRSPFLSADARAMLRALVMELDPARELRFSVLELNGHPLAYHLGFQHAGRLALYMTTFDLDYWNESPGAVLLRKAFEWAHEEQLTELDFTIGDEDYKTRYANRNGETFTVCFDRHPRSLAATVHRFIRQTRDTVRRDTGKASRARRVRSTFVTSARRLKHPVGFLRSTCGDGWPGVSSEEQVVVCRPVHRVACAPGVRVRRLTLKEFALLRLRHACLGDDAVEATRLAVLQGQAIYTVAVGPSDYVFLVSFAGAGAPREGEPTTPVTAIRLGAMPDSSSARKLAGAFAALLCTLESGNEVRLRSCHGGAMRAAVDLAGHELIAERRVDAADLTPAPGAPVNAPVLDAAE